MHETFQIKHFSLKLKNIFSYDDKEFLLFISSSLCGGELLLY